MYRFQNMEDILFIIPFNPTVNCVNVFVQLQKHYDFIFFKSFNVHNKDEKNGIDYLLKTLSIYPLQIRDSKDFFNKIGLDMNKLDISIITKHPILYHRSFYNERIILVRLVEELHITQLSQQ
eukprot:176485_1